MKGRPISLLFSVLVLFVTDLTCAGAGPLVANALPIGPSHDSTFRPSDLDRVEYSPDGTRLLFCNRANRYLDRGYVWDVKRQEFSEYAHSFDSDRPFKAVRPNRRGTVLLGGRRGPTPFAPLMLTDEGFAAVGPEGHLYHVDDQLRPRAAKPLLLPSGVQEYFKNGLFPDPAASARGAFFATFSRGNTGQAFLIDAIALQPRLNWTFVSKGNFLTDPRFIVLGRNAPIAAMVYTTGLQIVTPDVRPEGPGRIVSSPLPEGHKMGTTAVFVDGDSCLAHSVDGAPNGFRGVRFIDVKGEEIGRVVWDGGIRELQSSGDGKRLAVFGSHASGLIDLAGGAWRKRLSADEATEFHKVVYRSRAKRLSPDGNSIATASGRDGGDGVLAILDLSAWASRSGR